MDLRQLQRLIAILLLGVLMMGCNTPAVAPAATATSIPPTDVPTAVPPTPTSTATATPVPPTSTPTATPMSPTRTPTVEPTKPPTATPTRTLAPKPTAQVSSMALSDLLLKTMERMQIVGGLLDGAQTNLNAGFCDQFLPQYRTIIAVVTLNESGRAPAWIDSYGAYKAAVYYLQNKLYRAREVCDAGGSAIGKAEFNDMRGAVNASINALARAYDQLRVKNLLGQ